jgi:hypothetical protein
MAFVSEALCDDRWQVLVMTYVSPEISQLTGPLPPPPPTISVKEKNKMCVYVVCEMDYPQQNI